MDTTHRAGRATGTALTRLALVASLSWVAACSSPPPPAAPPAPPPRRDVLLVSIDTLRADRLGPTTMPVLDGLASTGLRFTNARTVAPLTLPAHVSLLTGWLPPAHGVRLNGQRFSGEAPTLARIARAAGYETAAFVGAYVLDRAFGLAEGFSTYDDQIRRDPTAVLRLEAERPATEVADHAMAWFRAHPATPTAAPLFAWVHFYDAHTPYAPPPPFLARAHGSAYDGEVAFVDAQVGRLLETLRDTGRAPNTLVIVVGDHGESLGEHGEATHGMLAYDATLRIPLVVAGPGVAPATRVEPVSLVDVAPTVLGALGVEKPPAMTGRSLLAPAAAAERDLYAETLYPETAGWSAVRVLTDGSLKLLSSSGAELYDLTRDPREKDDLAASRDATVRAMAARLRVVGAATGRGRGDAVSPDAAERLRALGYVAPSGPAPAPPATAVPNPARTIAAWVAFERAQASAAPPSAKTLKVLAGLANDHPDARVFQAAYARALAAGGKVPEALRRFADLVKRWPGDATLYHDMAVVAAGASRVAEAEKAERAALAVDPRYAAAHNGLGLLAARAGRHAEARASFERAVGLDASNVQYWTNFGNAARDDGDLAAAERAYRQALAIDPEDADAANGLGVLLVQSDRPADAVPWLEAATRRQASFVEAWLNLGIAYQQAGRIEDARAAFQRVTKAPPAFARERQAAATLLARLPAR